MSFCKKAALIISKLPLIGAEPETLTVNSLGFFFSFLAHKMRRKGEAKQAFFFFFPGIYETNKTSPSGNDLGSLHYRTSEGERPVENLESSSYPLLEVKYLQGQRAHYLLSLYIQSSFSVDHEKILP